MVYEVYAHNEVRRYKTHIWSKATLVAFVILALTWVPPILIGYDSNAFWPRVSDYQEQPNVHYKHQLLVVMDTSTSGAHVAWSTYTNFNALEGNSLRIPLIRSREQDVNNDGVNDRLQFELSMPLLDTEEVYAVKLILIFDYVLKKYSYFEMESMAYISYSSPVPGAGLQMNGDLRLLVQQPLGSVGTDARYNYSVIDGSSIYAEDYELGKIFNLYTARNVTTYLDEKYPLWVSGRGAGLPFVLNTTIYYPETYNIPYYTGFWQMVKSGWVQFFSYLVIFWFALSHIKKFIFSNQLVQTIVERPFKDKVL